MDDVFLTFDSVTYATKARKVLLRVGITTKLEKISSQKQDEGCSFGVMISGGDYFDAIRALRNANIRYNVKKT